MTIIIDAFTPGNPFWGTKLLGISIGRGFGAPKGLSFRQKTFPNDKNQRLHNWKPIFGYKLLGISIGRGIGALKGLRFRQGLFRMISLSFRQKPFPNDKNPQVFGRNLFRMTKIVNPLPTSKFILVYFQVFCLHVWSAVLKRLQPKIVGRCDSSLFRIFIFGCIPSRPCDFSAGTKYNFFFFFLK